ncbi:MAG: hypothetical protein JXR84_12435 [Anaerolineae bacterium]|nr:hypothetical protein [Anaerolineae bacterium]
MKPFARIWLVILTILVVMSLALNGYFFLIISNVQQGALDAITNARNNLATLSSEPIVIPVAIDQEIPFNTSVPISQTLVVPLDIDYPLSTVINTYVEIPLWGRQDIALPIETIIPIQYTLEVPIQVEVPISLTYHLQTEVPVEVIIPPEIRSSLDEVLRQAETELQ